MTFDEFVKGNATARFNIQVADKKDEIGNAMFANTVIKPDGSGAGMYIEWTIADNPLGLNQAYLKALKSSEFRSSFKNYEGEYDEMNNMFLLDMNRFRLSIDYAIY